MKVESIESILQYFWPAIINDRFWKPIFGSYFYNGHIRQVYCTYYFGIEFAKRRIKSGVFIIFIRLPYGRVLNK